MIKLSLNWKKEQKVNYYLNIVRLDNFKDFNKEKFNEINDRFSFFNTQFINLIEQDNTLQRKFTGFFS